MPDHFALVHVNGAGQPGYGSPVAFTKFPLRHSGRVLQRAGLEDHWRSSAVAPIKSPHSAYVQIEADAKAPSPDGAADYEQGFPEPDRQYKSGYERRTGGSTWHWLGHTPRMLRSDFEMKSRYGGGKDFP